jgi:NTE family protein
LHAIGYTPMEILYMFKTYCKNVTEYDKLVPLKIIGLAFTGKLNLKGVVKGNNLENVAKKYCINKSIRDISEVKMPLAIPTVDIETGEIVYYLSKTLNRLGRFDDIPTYNYHGDLSSIVRASSSMPGVFKPKYLDGKHLVDGGVRMNCPIEILKQMGASKVIAVCFDDSKNSKLGDMNIVSVAIKTFNIMGHEVNKEQLDLADYKINIKIDNVSLMDFSKLNYLANIGYKTTKDNIDKIKELLK